MARTLVLLATALPLLTAAAAEPDYGTARQKMVDTIEGLATRIAAAPGTDSLAPPVLAALRQVPRHEFVPAEARAAAYDNRPLPIGYGQTISQPYIVALMTDLVRPDKDDVVLEVGTGSGYQAAVLSPLVRRVYSLEIVDALAKRATERLAALGYGNVTVRHGDGYHGWPEHSPFDAIIVTAAASHIPPPLVRQLKPGGRMVIPVGPPFMAQNLMLVEKDTREQVHTRTLLPVHFVPLTGGNR
ncbi:protein-L-isoaspartate(D-aspartate) O-methyltransferase [Microvirga sp. VF16]|uniref:protein-L-isoaspartate(D-aspartate) O-methyltransferase n=1 Tax=Microvirga sp. VF16 TaxID=2807101 RepID=UPI00193CD42F|nr:protein-L-isoaspartate(D-aspartate) O-methyltransferase [Microvirga sp. VF16]QRM36105.1 protein-L-isoaspartate(D-aspartate) O-methyltransferase [Microvirga sp. VF16]